MMLSSIFDDFNKLKVLIIGDVMLDSYVWGKVERISPEAPVPIVNVQKSETRLGGAANVALNILALGASPILCSVIGMDADGSNLLRLMAEKGMTIEGMIQAEDRPTTIKHRIISGSQQMLRIDSETDRSITSTRTNLLFSKIEKLLTSCHVVIFEDYDKGVITPELIAKVVGMADRLGIPTVVDPKKRNFMAYENVSLFKPNLKELKEGLKIELNISDKENVKKAADLLRDKINAKATLITLSEHGVFISDGQQEHLIPAHTRTISDVSGAGDTVVSVAALCMALKLPLKQVAELSNLAGGIVCESVGVIPIDKVRLLEEAQKP
jgi:D-glycero-beta-D-manno-heptose-7-phosphate kinase